MNRLLLVDDEEGIRKVLGLSLKDEGYRVDTAEDGGRALSLFEENEYGMVITDIKMPGMDGLQLLREIKRRRPDTEVIIITGHGEMSSAIEALKLEASDFITKPINPDALTVALQRAEERIQIREKLRQYTENLEQMVEEKTARINHMYEFQKNLIENAQEGILAIDVEGKVLVVNRYMEELTGIPQKEIEQRSLQDVFPENVFHELETRIGNLRQDNGRTFLMDEAGILSWEGTPIPVQISATLLFEQGRYVGLLINAHDLRQMKKMQKELVESERLAAVGQTVAALAHTIKNILGGLRGGIYVVDKGMELNNSEYLSQGWEMVKRNVDRIKNMVVDLLAYAREREPEFSLLDPHEPAEEVFNLFDASAREQGVWLVKNWDTTLPKVSIDPNGIHACLSNIVTNAIEACCDPKAPERAKCVAIETGRDEKGYLLYRVTDNGCGMDHETRKKLFHRFFSTKGFGGTGLGLIVTEKIIREHGGSMEVSSEAGKGTTVILKIPCLTEHNVQEHR